MAVTEPDPVVDIVTRLGWLGVSYGELRRRLVKQFTFDPSLYSLDRYDKVKKHFSDYKKPTRTFLTETIIAAIEKLGATQKRPKVLAEAVVKRVYSTYPQETPFHLRWQKLDDASETRAMRARDRRTPYVNGNRHERRTQLG